MVVAVSVVGAVITAWIFPARKAFSVKREPIGSRAEFLGLESVASKRLSRRDHRLSDRTRGALRIAARYEIRAHFAGVLERDESRQLALIPRGSRVLANQLGRLTLGGIERDQTLARLF